MTQLQELRNYNRELLEKVNAAIELVGLIETNDIRNDVRATQLVTAICGESYLAEPRHHFSVPIPVGSKVMTIDGQPGILSVYKPIYRDDDIFVGAIVALDDGTPKHYRISELIPITQS